MSANKMTISVQLTPVIVKDEQTGMFIAKFEELSNASAYDETEENAILKLIGIFEVMLREQREVVIEKIFRKQLDAAIGHDPSINLIKISGDRSRERLKVQMVS